MEGKISTSSGKEISVEVGIRQLGKEEQKKHALKALAICWGISLATIPLPPLHWVTVPGFFIAGFVMFFRKLREPAYFEHVAFKCPECGAAVEVPPQVVQNPLAFVCPQCRYGLKLSF